MMTNKPLAVLILTVTFGLLLDTSLKAYQFNNYKWDKPESTVYVSMGEPWDSAFIAAMKIWTDNTVFKFIPVNEYYDPCIPSPTESVGRNGVRFMDDMCGVGWSSGVLGVARLTRDRNGRTLQAGVIFNTKWNWSVYDGPWTTDPADFRRVALHELGHTMGLAHEISNPAIMSASARTGDTKVTPQFDDLAGIRALYGGPTPTDRNGPEVAVTSHVDGQTVGTSSIILSGIASDAGRGDNAVTSVTVNGVRATEDSAFGGSTAIWRRTIDLNPGANTVAIVARDGSTNQNSSSLSTTITYQAVPANDSFANRTRLVGELNSRTIFTSQSGTVTGFNDRATSETSEPAHRSGSSNSVWWTFAAGVSGTLTFDTVGSGFDTFLTVYTGTTLATLTKVAENDNGGGNLTSRVRFAATAGTTYQIAVVGTQNSSGPIKLNWDFSTEAFSISTGFHVFPQVADGFLSDGSVFRSTLMVLPVGTNAVTCTWTIYGMTMTLENGQTGTSFTLGVTANGYTVMKTNSSGALQSGYSTLNCTDAVFAQVLYTFSAADGSKFSEATVFSSEAANGFRLILDQRGGEQLAIALANNTDSAKFYRVILRTSTVAHEASFQVPARRNAAQFVNTWLPAASGQVGVLTIISTDNSDFYAIGLRFTGNVFTTIPAN